MVQRILKKMMYFIGIMKGIYGIHMGIGIGLNANLYYDIFGKIFIGVSC